MIITEAEAKTKWCPFARVNDGTLTSFNRFWRKFGEFYHREDQDHRDKMCRCITTGCMAWRRSKVATAQGYCGLAGTPP